MIGSFILAHDLGTTGNKAALYDGAGKVLASAIAAYSTAFPQAAWAEQNPEDWWQAVCTTTQQLLAAAHVEPHAIACIVFSGQMMGCVAVDGRARPLRSAIIWADQRASAQAQELVDKVGLDNVYRVTGHRASPSYSGAKILWLKQRQPEIFAQTRCFLQAKDFIVARLCGRFASDYSDASGTNLYDLAAGDWSQSILDAIGIDRSLLPELHASTDIVGEVTTQAASATGLAAGTPVVIGGGDGSCAATGAGVVSPGSAYNYIGASSWIGMASSTPLLDPAMRTFTFAHLVPGMFTPTGTMQAAGASYQWLRDTICLPEKAAAEESGRSPYELMDALAEQSPPGVNGLLFLPYLLGERSPRWNPNARGAYVGLSAKHSRADIVRAMLEGITLNLRVILDAFQEQGAHIVAMRVIGGGAGGRVWRQIMADVYNMPVQRPALLEEATSLGAAIAGGVAVGLFKDFSIAERLTPIHDTTLPDAQAAAVYQRLYGIFNRTYDALAPVYDDLAAL